MPEGAWYLLIAALLVAVVFAIWKGRGLVVSHSKDGMKIAVQEGTPTPPPPHHIAVASGASIEGSTTGDIGGIITHGNVGQSATADIDVLSQGHIRNSKTGDIAGVKQTDGAKQPDVDRS